MYAKNMSIAVIVMCAIIRKENPYHDLIRKCQHWEYRAQLRPSPEYLSWSARS
jgi:hypothetical protein